MFRIPVVVLLFAILLGESATGQPPANGSSTWLFDEITLVNGAKFHGVLLTELPEGVRFQWVSRPPGRPTMTLTSFYARSEIKALKKLSDEDRKALEQRLAELDPTGQVERQRMESLEVVVVDWPGKPNGARRYESDYFVLESDGSEQLLRRSAVRLEQVYAAFMRFLPPTTLHLHPTRIMLAMDLEEYRTLLGPLGELHLLNPAVFDPNANRILCWSDLKRLGEELQTVSLHHSQQLTTLKQYEENVTKLYKDQKELARFLAPISLERGRIATADAANNARFNKATTRLFAILYHEAFHAYVGTFLYPPLKPEEVKAGKGTGELPRWLNEGLAQVFETAIVEAGELRADSPDPDRLKRVKEWLKGKGPDRLLPLSELFVTGKDAFLAFHAYQRAVTDRAYLTSWALAYYLVFEAQPDRDSRVPQVPDRGQFRR